ncbi:MAG: 50S ribosomal protein L20 [Deltaproteobacteria bacterium]|nr:50S ribosomal protein L20 [bacterium]MCB9475477.1 50S ribosomal protein L20 [Deltaproteobacteria bacterium]MCB9488520.1 50S ribosomal protein L20 [Deltaproteobacteria bacterium]
MPRAKGGTKTRARHNKILKLAKGYREARGSHFSVAQESVRKALTNQYRDRRTKKRDFRRLWIVRISAAAKENGMSYSRLMHGLKLAGIDLDRKMLAEMAVYDKAAFAQIVEQAKQAM